ncbi:MAG: Circadian input kinase A [uncultured Paraburkholderia sp.]|uniref:excisionase family DNA-binding protein n=1 Tax=uncultured Paraburkholderia sp. TaxID=1822466 RepID=UPI002591A23C|nr:excisionase family DNA-binding protein [uncultured Paraburkholderia sp.]CAH2903138.1 MAG: Circadian input kinase A [uncultured Paraburkholderia sp.]CAH2938893.1 MAG: Circadian input kinase A [uncultured Paraburkholderia sp.]
MDDPIITTREAAELLGVSIRTAQTWIEQNALDSWKTPGGHRRVRRSAVIDLKARLAGERIELPSLVLVHAPQHRLRRYVEPLEFMPECTVRESSDPFATLLTAGYLLPPVIVVDCEPDDDDCLRLVRAILEHPSLGHTDVIMAGDVSRDAAQWRVAARRVHVIAADASAVTLGAMVRRLLDGARQSTHLAATPLTGETAGNESQRLMAVAASGLVDTPAEEAFDDITRLAATMLEAPIALLTLLTPDRQWFKSHWGLETGETPRSWAFCNYTILQHEVFVVEDATVDLRFAENPLVTGEPHIRFYAGANIRGAQGYALGSLAIIDRRPRRLLSSQRDALATLGRLASDRINLRIRERQLRWAMAPTAKRSLMVDN